MPPCTPTTRYLRLKSEVRIVVDRCCWRVQCVCVCTMSVPPSPASAEDRRVAQPSGPPRPPTSSTRRKEADASAPRLNHRRAPPASSGRLSSGCGSPRASPRTSSAGICVAAARVRDGSSVSGLVGSPRGRPSPGRTARVHCLH